MREAPDRGMTRHGRVLRRRLCLTSLSILTATHEAVRLPRFPCLSIDRNENPDSYPRRSGVHGAPMLRAYIDRSSDYLLTSSSILTGLIPSRRYAQVTMHPQ
jgi:hypothetical protein